MKKLSIFLLVLIMITLVSSCVFAQDTTSTAPPASNNELVETFTKILTMFIVPFVVSAIGGVKWSDTAKFALLVLISTIGAVLNLMLSGDFSGLNLVQSASAIFIGAQAFYRVAFKGLGLEKVLFPKEALVSDGKKQLQQQISGYSTEKAADILDKDSDTTMLVNARVV